MSQKSSSPIWKIPEEVRSSKRSILRTSYGAVNESYFKNDNSECKKSVGFLLNFADVPKSDSPAPIPDLETIKKALLNEKVDQRLAFKHSEYKFIRTIGSGAFATVMEAVWLPKEEHVAVKIIPFEKLVNQEKSLKIELDILSSVRHPNLLRLFDWGFGKETVMIVTEYAKGGELFDRIAEYQHLKESDVATIVRKCLEAVSYLHSLNIVHRDLKPENIFLKNPTEHEDFEDILVGDFGISNIISKDELFLTSKAGTFGYAAPEILMSLPYSKPVDIWSIGVITYSLFTGCMPYSGEGFDEELEDILDHRLNFDEYFWKDISNEGKKFVSDCLKVSPNLRPTAEQALNHIWLKKWPPTPRKPSNANSDRNSSTHFTFQKASDFSPLLPVPGRYEPSSQSTNAHPANPNLFIRLRDSLMKRREQIKNKPEDETLAKHARSLLRMSSYDNLAVLNSQQDLDLDDEEEKGVEV